MSDEPIPQKPSLKFADYEAEYADVHVEKLLLQNLRMANLKPYQMAAIFLRLLELVANSEMPSFERVWAMDFAMDLRENISVAKFEELYDVEAFYYLADKSYKRLIMTAKYPEYFKLLIPEEWSSPV